MSRATRLSDAEIARRLSVMPHWRHRGGALVHTQELPSPTQALEFARAVTELAERIAHYPDILIQQNRVTLSYSTAAAKGVTYVDIDAAYQVEEVIGRWRKARPG